MDTKALLKAQKARHQLRDAVKKDVVRAEAKTGIFPASFLLQATNHDEDWWIAIVQSLVSKHSDKTDNPDHGSTNVKALITDLAGLVVDTAPPDAVYDENMRTAAVLGAILSVWYARLQFAKASDPNRPVFFRQLGYKRHLEYVAWLNAAMIDGRNDSHRFPGQRWKNPYVKGAQGGEFI